MIITNVNSGQKSEISLSGKTLTVGTVSIDLAKRQKSEQVIIDVCMDNNLETMREGLGAWNVATIIIPPLQHRFVKDGTDKDGEDQYKYEKRPLNIMDVEVRLWTLPKEQGGEE